MSANASQSVRMRFEQRTLPRLSALARRIRLYLLLDGLAILSPAILAAVLITLAFDHTFRLDLSMRYVQAIAVLGILGGLTWRHILRPASVSISEGDLAALVERSNPQLGGRLLSATEFTPAADKPPRGSPALIDKVIEQAEIEAARLNFTSSLNHRRAARQAAVGLAGLGAIAALLLFAPATMGLWFERNVKLGSVDWPLRNRLTVEGLTNGKLIVPRGDDAVIAAAVVPGYEPPRQAYIHYRGTGGLRGQAQMPEVRGQLVRFTYTFERLSETLTCRIVGGDAETDPFTVEVIDRPSITSARISIVPPTYSGIEPYKLREGQNAAEALLGSEIRLQITADQPIASAALVRDIGGKQATLGPAQRLGDRQFTATDKPSASAAYHFELTGDSGLSNIGPRTPPARFTVRLNPDQAPTVKMRVRGVGEMITPQAVLPVDLELSDAYGLASASVVFASAKSSNQPTAEPLPDFEKAARSLSRSIEWSVDQHGLAEGDRLSLWAEAADFDDVSGPNVGRSSTAVFRIVSREELAAELNRRQHQYRQDFERYLRRQEELLSELLSAAQEVTGETERQQRAQRLRQLARRQRDQAGQVNTTWQQFEQVLSEMRVNGLATPTVEERIGRGIAQPLRDLTKEQMPAAAEQIDGLAGEHDAASAQEARNAQTAIRDQMNAILAQMLEWERLEEAVILLRDVLNMQRNVGKETETTLERDIFGTAPAK